MLLGLGSVDWMVTCLLGVAVFWSCYDEKGSFPELVEERRCKR